MIRILGAKRLAVVLILLVFNIIMGAAVYAYVMPENEKLAMEVRNLRSQVNSRRSEIDRLGMEYRQIQEQKSYFEGLEAAGFFSDQNRVLARNKIEAVQRYAGILTAGYNISPAKVEASDLATGTGHALVSSPVTLNLEAMDDVDIYSFIFWLENAFPGQVSIESVRIERLADIDEVTLRQIGSGVETSLARAMVGFKWYTMMPEKILGVAGEGGNGI